MTGSDSAVPLRIVIVDDEPLARSGLVAAIRRVRAQGGFPLMDVVAQCGDGPAGLLAIRQFGPDILLLDISMPEMDGFAMLAQLRPLEKPAAVIFITAHSQHAVRAFDVAAGDYLVKPIADKRLAGALSRAVARIEEQRLASRQRELLRSGSGGGYLQQLTVPERGYHTVVPVQEIESIQGSQSYVRVRTANSSRLLRARLQVLERQLNPAQFYRCHRSAIVRLGAIREIRTAVGAKATVILTSGARLPLSRGRIAGLQGKLAGKPRNDDGRMEGRNG